MKFCTLFSGSSGNATFVSAGSTSLLIDAGAAGVKIEKALESIGENVLGLSGIFITHEHTDHIAGAGVLARRHGIPIYGNRKTLEYMSENGLLKKICPENIRPIEGNEIEINDLLIRKFRISHDAADPCGYTLTDGNVKMALATDTGIVTDEIRDNVLGADAVILEANHDLSMLEFGPYPFYLKQRIKSELGHLSNDTAADFALQTVKKGTSAVVLGHLSVENNYPQLAYETVNAEFVKNGVEGVKLSVAPRFVPGAVTEVTHA